jgi:hypothetical protein
VSYTRAHNERVVQRAKSKTKIQSKKPNAGETTTECGREVKQKYSQKRNRKPNAGENKTKIQSKKPNAGETGREVKQKYSLPIHTSEPDGFSKKMST